MSGITKKKCFSNFTHKRNLFVPANHALICTFPIWNSTKTTFLAADSLKWRWNYNLAAVTTFHVPEGKSLKSHEDMLKSFPSRYLSIVENRCSEAIQQPEIASKVPVVLRGSLHIKIFAAGFPSSVWGTRYLCLVSDLNKHRASVTLIRPLTWRGKMSFINLVWTKDGISLAFTQVDGQPFSGTFTKIAN